MKRVRIKLNSLEMKIIIKSLNELRNNLISENITTDAVDEMLIKCIKNLERMRPDY